MNKTKSNVVDLFFKKINCTNENLKISINKKINFLPPILSKKQFDLDLTQWLFLNQQDTFIYLGYLRAALLCKEEQQISAERAKQLATFFDWYVSKKTQDFLDAGVSQKTAFYSTYTEYGFNEDFAIQHGISLLIKPVFESIADLLQAEHTELLKAIFKSVLNVYTIEALTFNFYINTHAYNLLLNVKGDFKHEIFNLTIRSKLNLFVPSAMKESLVFCNDSLSVELLKTLVSHTDNFYRYNTNDLKLVLENTQLQANSRFQLFVAFSLTAIHQLSINDVFPYLLKIDAAVLKQAFEAIGISSKLETEQIQILIQRLELKDQLNDF